MSLRSFRLRHSKTNFHHDGGKLITESASTARFLPSKRRKDRGLRLLCCLQTSEEVHDIAIRIASTNRSIICRSLQRHLADTQRVPVVQWIERGFPSTCTLMYRDAQNQEIRRRWTTWIVIDRCNFAPLTRRLMATVRRVPKSPYWIAKYRDGAIVKFRSTKQTSKSAALKIALDWEDQARLANAGGVDPGHSA